MHHYESLSRNVPGFVGIFVSKVRLIKGPVCPFWRGAAEAYKESLSREAACLFLLLLLLSGGAAPNRLSSDYSRADRTLLLLQLLRSIFKDALFEDEAQMWKNFFNRMTFAASSPITQRIIMIKPTIYPLHPQKRASVHQI